MHTFSLHIKTLIFVPFLVLLLACVDESSLMSTSDLVIINNLDEGVETRMNGESDSMMNTPIHMTSNRDASTTDVQIDLGSLTDMTVNQTNRDMDSPSDISINFGLDRELIEDRGVRDAEMHTIMDAELDLDFLTRLDVGQAPDLNTWLPYELDFTPSPACLYPGKLARWLYLSSSTFDHYLFIINIIV